MHAQIFLIAHQYIINAHFVCVYISGRCTVNQQLYSQACWCCILLLLQNFTKLSMTV